MRISVTVSILIFATSAILFATGCFTDPWKHRVSVGDSFHIGVWNQGLDSRIIFFNNAKYGPYRGSLIDVIDENGKRHSPPLEERAIGDSWGVYYRYFRWADVALWTLMVTLWYPLSLSSLVLAMQFWKARLRWKRVDLVETQ